MSTKMSAELSKHRLEQAKVALDDAKYNYKDSRYLNANNRAYYSIFYSMRAVLALEPIDFKKHSQLQGYFNKKYINTEIFPKKFGHKIAQARTIREDSDYDDDFVADEEKTKAQIDTAEELIKYVEEYINNYIKENKLE